MICHVMWPVHKINKGANIVLYGAGDFGRKLWKINKELSWCNIVAVFDRNYKEITDFPQIVESPERIKGNLYCDYLLIAVASPKQRLEIKKYLIGLGVEEYKIIDKISYIFDDDAPSEYEIAFCTNYSDSASFPIKIAFRPIGSMGDLIISLKLYQELIRIEHRVIIDVVVDDVGVAKSVFYNQSNLGNVIKYSYNIEEGKYDVYIDVRFEPHICKCNFGKLKKLSPALYECMEKLYNYQKQYYVDCGKYQYTNRILFDRAKLHKMNRYKLFNISNAFNIDDMKVELYLNQTYLSQYKKIGLKKYITYNYGAHDQFGDGKDQVKMWPYAYLVELNKMIKKRFQSYELIQLGGKDAKKIPGADRYILGKDLELVKFILKSSLLHFDCEGGLVHMATQLGTKCVVVFGPTPIWFYGYPQNINIGVKVCGECKGVYPDWYTVCHRYNRPECMLSIKPEVVMAKISQVLSSV